MQESAEPFMPRVGWLAAIFFVALTLILSLSIRQNLNVDENPFIASGVLLLQGILPYRDYLYYHLPTLVIIYSALFRVSDHLLFTARAFSVVCGALTVTLLVAAAWYWLRDRKQARGWAFGVGLLFLFDPVFTYTSGQAWNHDFPAVTCLAGLLCLFAGVSRERKAIWMVWAGAGLGLAMTSRLTFFVAPLAYLVFLASVPGLGRGERVKLTAWLGFGAILVSLPSLWICWQSPANAWFGNLGYPALNTRYHITHNFSGRRAFTLFDRIGYVVLHWFKLPGDGIVTALVVFFSGAALRRFKPFADRRAAELLAILILTVCLLGTAFAASPMFEQYLYAPVPFMVLGIARAISMLPDFTDRTAVRRTFGVCVGVCVVVGAVAFRGVLLLPTISKWEPMKAHALGQRIANITGGREVLTLEVVYPLEGKLPIMPELATGRFEVRSAAYLSPAELRARKMLSRGEVIALLQKDPDLPLLTTGADSETEDLLTQIASGFGDRRIGLPRVGALWVPASMAPQNDVEPPIAGR